MTLVRDSRRLGVNEYAGGGEKRTENQVVGETSGEWVVKKGKWVVLLGIFVDHYVTTETF